MDLGSQPSTAGVEPPLLDQGWEPEQSPCLLGSTSLEPSHSNVDHRSGGVELPSAPLPPPLPLWGDCNTCLKFEGKGSCSEPHLHQGQSLFLLGFRFSVCS